MLDTLIANAVKLSGATKGHVRQLDGEFLRVVAYYGETAEQIALYHSRPVPAVPERAGGRALLEKKPIHILEYKRRKMSPRSLVRLGNGPDWQCPCYERAPRSAPSQYGATLSNLLQIDKSSWLRLSPTRR